MFSKKKVVIVEWEDATSNSGYYRENDKTTYGKVLCRTVGYILKRNKEQVVLGSEVFIDGDFRHTHSIPRKMVKSIKILNGEIK